MTSAPAAEETSAPPAWLTVLLLGVIVALNVAGSLYWVRANVVLTGRDAGEYLLVSLQYSDFVNFLSPRALFQAFTWPAYRAPAIYIAAQPFLRLFGANMDGAQLLNVTLLALLVPLTWLLARAVTGRWTALFAALLVGLLPMSAAMARLFYTEMFLMVTVVLTLLALYRSRGFTHFGWSPVFGLSLGIGLLVKWTMPIYVALPLLWVLWSERRTLVAGLRFAPRRALLALIAALGFAALWYWPNRDLADRYPLGPWLFAGWLLLAWGSFYFMSARRTLAENILGALFVAALVASLWYLPHSNFARELLSADVERGSDPLGLFSAIKFTRYFDYLYATHFGALAFWLIVPAALVPWLWALARRTSLAPRAVLLWLSLLSAYAVLVLLSQRNARNLSPLMPQLTILLAAGIAAWPRAIRWTVGIVAVLVLALQWTLITTDATYAFYARTGNLWATSDYPRPPASGATDPDLWVAPQILADVVGEATTVQPLGNLVNADFLHRGSLKYLIEAGELPVEVNDLTEETALWEGLIASTQVLVKDGSNKDVEDAGLALIERIRRGDPLFGALYVKKADYPLPNGETVTLFQRTQGPGFPKSNPAMNEQSAAVAEAIRTGWSDHASLLYANGDVAVWVGRFDPASERLIVLPSEDGAAIAQMETVTGTLFVVLDPNQQALAAWLEQNGYKAHEVGGDGVWVTIVGRPERALEDTDFGVGSWPGMSLTSLGSWDAIAPGEVLPLKVAFEGADGSRKWSVRLVDGQGVQVAGADRSILPTDQFGLFVPPQTPAGVYHVTAQVYDGATLSAVADDAGRDVVPVFDVRVTR